MLNTRRLMLYIHGSAGDSNSGKAHQFREWFPGMVTPDFKGSFDERMSQLYSIITDRVGWTLVGSSQISPIASWKMIIDCIRRPTKLIGNPSLPKPVSFTSGG